MDDTFMEKIVRQKKTTGDRLKMAGYIIAAIFLMLLVIVFSPFIGFFFPLFLAGIIYVLWILLSNMNCEFEYIVTNGEIDIDKIIARRRRKRVYSGHVRDFEILAKTSSDDYQQAKKGANKLLDCSSHPEAKQNWFFIADYKGSRLLILFEPDEKMLAAMKRYNPRNVKYDKFRA